MDIDVRVVEVGSVRPLDSVALASHAEGVKGVVTVEEGVTSGGMGSAVVAAVTRVRAVHTLSLGIDAFAPTGSPEQIMHAYGLDLDGLHATIHKWFSARLAA